MTGEMARIIHLHKRWADGYTIIRLGFMPMLLGGVQFFLTTRKSGRPNPSQS
ncbi:MAG TPA: hypothetical protein VMM15_12395 [Bradyrhizobium sp.]|nr:hypothetical protein [Bradyrhizobium sp.]